MRFENLVDKEQVGEQGADVNVRVQVVDHLRGNRGLREHHLHSRLCGTCVSIDNVDESAIRLGIKAQSRDVAGEERAEAVQSALELAEELADLSGFLRQSLRSVRQEEFVRFFEVVGARGEAGGKRPVVRLGDVLELGEAGPCLFFQRGDGSIRELRRLLAVAQVRVGDGTAESIGGGLGRGAGGAGCQEQQRKERLRGARARVSLHDRPRPVPPAHAAQPPRHRTGTTAAAFTFTFAGSISVAFTSAIPDTDTKFYYRHATKLT